MLFDFEGMQHQIETFSYKLKTARKIIQHPLTLSEKILYAHYADSLTPPIVRGKSYGLFSPDKIVMQDSAAQMVLLQFALSGRKKTAVSTSVHCDRLVIAENGAREDLNRSLHDDKEVFDFLESSCRKYGIDFWKPGAGIIHQTVLENYAFPGGLLIGTDSHTAMAGGLGMLAFAVGGCDAIDVMAGMSWEFKFPRLIGIKLTGQLSGWGTAKDVILKLAGILSVKESSGAIIEYFGEGAKSISCSGKATICNMGAEIGALASVFPYDERMSDYLKANGRENASRLSDSIKEDLKADSEVEEHPDKYYDQIINLNLSELEPHVSGPFSSHMTYKLSDFADAVKKNGYPEKLSAALIGSCVNSSYEDIGRAASIASQALKHGLKVRCPLIISPGSEQIRSTAERDGFLKVLEDIGAVILANACGPCSGQWKRRDVNFGEKNAILTSFNRITAGRNDANPGTHAFIASPEIVVAFSLSGKLTFNPLLETLINEDGLPVKFQAPTVEEFPKNGFDKKGYGFVSQSDEDGQIEIVIDPESERLQLLKPFESWGGNDFNELRILAKFCGKCTAEQISPAGKWLRFRGHLERISDNLFLGAVNAFTKEVGKGKNVLNGDMEYFSKIAKEYKKQGIRWVVIADENYGEGSARELAAIEPRYLGCAAIIAKSFSRSHERNLKKQGVLALTFIRPEDYDKLQQDDQCMIEGLSTLAPGKPLTLKVRRVGSHEETIPLNHTYTEEHIAWFTAGSALNLLNQQKKI